MKVSTRIQTEIDMMLKFCTESVCVCVCVCVFSDLSVVLCQMLFGPWTHELPPPLCKSDLYTDKTVHKHRQAQIERDH